MDILEQLGNFIKLLLGIPCDCWAKRTSISTKDIEICNGKAIDDEISNTCAYCVALNKTIFKGNNLPLYKHPRCRCLWLPTKLNHVILDFPQEKITKYLLFEENKFAMMRSMGYNKENANELYKKISQEISRGFLNNQYQLKTLNENGQHIQINFVLDGKNEHSHEKFNCHTGCVVWPEGKIKIATPLLKD